MKTETIEWIATTELKHPDKPGKKSYEIVPCLVVHKGEIEICAWNCEHGVWDDRDGDDFRYKAEEVSHWMHLPPPPPACRQLSPSVASLGLTVSGANTPK